MARQTTLMKITFPSENEQPFAETFKAGMDQQDEIHYANAENTNLVWTSAGNVSWNLGTKTLTWAANILITGMSTGPFFATVPAGSITLEDGEVAYFPMPRKLLASQNVALVRSNRVFSVDRRLNDLRLFAVRIGGTVLFPNATSLMDGQSAQIFGGGILAGIGTIADIQLGVSGGITILNGTGPVTTISLPWAGTGGNFGTALTPSRSDHSHPGVSHNHEAQLRIVPGAGLASLNLDADGAITAKTLLWAAIYRNGSRLSDPDHVVINLGGKSAALAFTTTATDLFIVDRVAI